MSTSFTPRTRESFFKLVGFYQQSKPNPELVQDFKKLQEETPDLVPVNAEVGALKEALKNLAAQIKQNPNHSLNDSELALVKIFLRHSQKSGQGAEPFPLEEWIHLNTGLLALQNQRLAELEGGLSHRAGNFNVDSNPEPIRRHNFGNFGIHYQDAQTAANRIAELPSKIKHDFEVKAYNQLSLNFGEGAENYELTWNVDTLRFFRDFLKEHGFIREGQIAHRLAVLLQFAPNGAQLDIWHNEDFFARTYEMIRLVYPDEKAANFPEQLRELLKHCRNYVRQRGLGADYAARRGLTEILPEKYIPDPNISTYESGIHPLNQNFNHATLDHFTLNDFQVEVLSLALHFHPRLDWRARNTYVKYLTFVKNHGANPAKILAWMVEVQPYLPPGSLIKKRFDLLWRDYRTLLGRWGHPTSLNFSPDQGFKKFELDDAWKHDFNPRMKKPSLGILARGLHHLLQEAPLPIADRIEAEKTLLFLEYSINRPGSLALEHLPYIQSAFTLIDRYLPSTYPQTAALKRILGPKRLAPSAEPARAAGRGSQEKPFQEAPQALSVTTASPAHKITRAQLQSALEDWRKVNYLQKRQKADDFINMMLEYVRQENPHLYSSEYEAAELLVALSHSLTRSQTSPVQELARLLSEKPEERRIMIDKLIGESSQRTKPITIKREAPQGRRRGLR